MWLWLLRFPACRGLTGIWTMGPLQVLLRRWTLPCELLNLKRRQWVYGLTALSANFGGPLAILVLLDLSILTCCYGDHQWSIQKTDTPFTGEAVELTGQWIEVEIDGAVITFASKVRDQELVQFGPI